MPQVYIAAGSNVEPERHLAMASTELEKHFPGVRFSAWYRNRAVGFEGDDFINFVAGFSTDLAIEDVVERLHFIEAVCGRTREAPRWAPRTMDLDVLLYGDLVRQTATLKVPRPDLLKRAYMLGPLADLAPEVVHPTEKLPIGELWRRIDRAAHPLARVRPGGKGGV